MKEINFNFHTNKENKRFKKKLLLTLLALFLGFIFFNTRLLNREIIITNNTRNEQKNNSSWLKNFANLFLFTQNQAEEIDPDYIMPIKEPERLDILILGIRGENDPDADAAGALLTDTIMIFSYDKLSKKSSLVSIPRDLYVKIYGKGNKINAAYEYGLINKEGIEYVKKLISQITGVFIDHAVVVDFSSFEKLIDHLGGIDITLTKPFKEEGQWGYVFELPAGKNHLNGQEALYYARSRYSTSDFDRAFRQQQILFAIKEKIVKLNLITDPVKILSLFNLLNKNIKTDINIWEIKDLIDMGNEIINSANIKKEVLSTDNLLYQSVGPNKEYILLPLGDNFVQIKKFFSDILYNN
jgi:LCP family protein required for cell wall assembly